MSPSFRATVLDQVLIRLRTSLMVEYRTTKRIQEQYTAFMEGFNELIPQELVNVFDERELELLIGGISESTFPSLPFALPLQTNAFASLPPCSRRRRLGQVHRLPRVLD